MREARTRAGVPATGFAYFDAPRERGEVLALAHRGGARHPDIAGVENTMAAFRHASGLGYRYLETDVQLTRDGVLVAFHDPDLDRATDGSGLVRDLPYAEVAQARVGGREPVPSLVEVLEELPDTMLNIDLKTPRAVGPMIDLVESMGLHDRVCLGSFDEITIRRFRRDCSRPVATTCGILAVGLVAYVPLGRHLPAVLRGGGAAFQVPRSHRGLPLLSRGFVRRAHAAGCHVHVWTLDDRAEIEAALDLGVDGIITDRTDVLRDVLVDRGQWDRAVQEGPS